MILGMLSVAPNLSGYDIRKGIEESVGYFWGESYGQIYPTLKRLAAEGLIVPGTASGSAKKRQVYSFTDAGSACLREWLALPFHNEPPRNEFLLKLFFGREASPGVAMAHVQDCIDRNRKALATMAGLEEMARKQAAQNPHQPYWLLTLSLGAAMTRAALEWGKQALETLGAMEATDGQRTGARVETESATGPVIEMEKAR